MKFIIMKNYVTNLIKLKNYDLKRCRVCDSEKLTKVFSLGYQPLANNLEDKITNSKKYPWN